MSNQVEEPKASPSQWVQRFAHLVPIPSRILDLAAGRGRNTKHFLSLGHYVTAVDIEISNLDKLPPHSKLEIIQTDVELCQSWSIIHEKFDAVIVSNYLHRPLFPKIIDIIAQNGLLIYETFSRGNAAFGRPSNPDFLLNPGELIDVFHPFLQIIAYEYGLESTPKKAVRQRICAIKSTSIASL